MRRQYTLFLAALLAACATTERAERPRPELFAARAADDATRVSQSNALFETLMQRARAKAEASAKGAPATIDFLVISGGGDWGAFGAGVLKGWGKVKGDLARPQFDVVTG